MRKLLLATFLAFSCAAPAQVFWTENFNNGCTANCAANAYVGANGAWTQTVTGAEGADPNLWYVSCAENGHTNNICGSGCVPSSATATLATLHVGSNPNSFGDIGAAYDAGGLCGFWVCPQTNRRIESPTINCTGQTGITLSFNYIENGAPPNDDASVWYYDGATWALLVNTPQTLVNCPGGQGRWTAYSIALPASANNNPNVKIGFLWVNNDDGVGTDPSFAVDDITLSVVSTGAPVAAFTASATNVCVGQAVNFTDNSTGSPTSWSWTFPSGTPATATTQNVTGVTWAAAGTYTVTLTATNSNGSSNSTQVITVNPLPTVTATANPATICPGAQSTLTGGGASTYVWNPGNISGSPVNVTPASTTTYTVTGTSAAGCVNTQTVTVTVDPLPTVTASASPATICAGSQSTLTGGGASTYVWNPGNISGSPVNVTPASTTTYTVTGTSAAGCTNTATVTVTVNSFPAVTATASPDTICTGQQSALSGSGASTYVWNPGNISGSPVNVTPASTTTYTVTGTDANGCTGTTQVTVTVQACAGPIAAFSATDTSICVGQAIDFTDLSGGAPTSWSWAFPGGTPATASTQNVTGVTWATAGTYTVTLTATNTNGSSNASLVITVNPLPNIIVSANPTAICVGQQSTLTASGASTYVWQPGNLTGSPVTVSPAVTTTYTVTGTSAAGCVNTAQVSILVQPCPAPVVQFTASDTTICVGDCINFTDQSTNGPTSWNWTFAGAATGASAAQNPTNICYPTAGTYAVTLVATNANGSGSLTKTAYIVVNAAPAANAGPDATICTGQQTTLIGSGGGTYNWQPGNQTTSSILVNPATTTTYTLTVTDANGCTGTDQVVVTVQPCAPPVAAFTVSDNSICESTCIDFTDNSTGTPTGWSWSFPGATPATSTAQDPTNICYNTPGTYSVTLVVTNAFGTDTFVYSSVTVGAQPTVDAGAYTTIAIGNSTQLNATGGSGGSYVWLPPTGLSNANLANPVASPLTTTTYTVTYTDANGCTDSDTVTVEVIEAYEIFIPSAFSPNGDGANDVLYVRGAGIQTLEFVVFNRFGEKVFESGSINDGWDATFRGKEVDTGIYVYYVNATFYNGTSQTLKGDVSLVR